MAGTPPMCLSGNEISVDVMHDGNEAIWDCHRLSFDTWVYQHIDMPLGFHALIQFSYQYPVLTSFSSDVGLFFFFFFRKKEYCNILYSFLYVFGPNMKRKQRIGFEFFVLK